MIALRVALAFALVLVAYIVFRQRPQPRAARPLDLKLASTLDWLRGLAAVSVLFGHVRGLFLQDYEAVKHPSVAWKVFYLLSGLGHQAVIVFFILSGFLVGSAVIARDADQNWSFKDYFGRRLVRLYVVLIPGLLLTYAWDSLGLHFFGADGLYGGHLAAAHLSMPDVRVTLSPRHFFGNLFFLQHMFVAPYGTNGPLWSLSYEFWAYLLFPLLVRASQPRESAPTRLAYGVACLAVLAVGGFKLLLYFSIWLLGAGAALVRQHRPAGNARLILSLLSWGLFGVCVLLGRSSRLSDWYADPILGCATGLLVGYLATRSASPKSPRLERSAKAGAWLAGFSYTLYVAHYPVLSFLFAAWLGQRLAPSVSSVGLTCLISIGVLLLYAYPLSRFTEAHTETLRRRFARRVEA